MNSTARKRTPATAEVLKLQKKFLHPASFASEELEKLVYRGLPQQNRDADKSRWEAAPEAQEPDAEYFSRPYKDHAEYVSQLKRISKKFPEEMKRKNDKGKTMESIVINGSSASHFGYLFNVDVGQLTVLGQSTMLSHWLSDKYYSFF
jgi:hypothetical protein